MGYGRPESDAHFRAPYDALVGGLTIAFTTILLAVAAIAAATGTAIGVLLACLFALLLLGAWAYAPTGYRVGPGTLVVERPIGALPVSLAGLQNATRTRARVRAKLGYRNGGLFGVYGRVYSRREGWTLFWGRSTKNVVALQFAQRTVLVMPDDPDALVAALLAAR